MQPVRYIYRTAARPLISQKCPLRSGSVRYNIRRNHDVPGGLSQAIYYVAETPVSCAQWALDMMHSTGLPWYATLPVAAIFVRLAIYTPLIRLPSDAANQRRLDTRPILRARFEYLKRTVPRYSQNTGPWTAQRQLKYYLNAHTKMLNSRWHISAWQTTVLPLLQLPLFVSFSEAIRRITGTHASLLGLLAERMSPKTAERIESSEALGHFQDVAAPWIEESMKTEGMLWFTDLTAPDPTGILSYATSAVMFFHIWRITNPARNITGQSVGRFGIAVRRIMLIIAAWVGVGTGSMPSGIMLYWFSSSLTTTVFSVFWDRVRPMKVPPGLPNKSGAEKPFKERLLAMAGKNRKP